MRHSSVTRSLAAAVACAALLLTSAGACGPAGDEDDAPGITDQQGGDDQGGDDQGGDDQGGDDQGEQDGDDGDG